MCVCVCSCTEGSVYEGSVCNEGSICGSDSAFYRQTEGFHLDLRHASPAFRPYWVEGLIKYSLLVKECVSPWCVCSEHNMAETLSVALRVAEEAVDEAISKAEVDASTQVPCALHGSSLLFF